MHETEQYYGRFYLEASKKMDRAVRKLYPQPELTGKEFADSKLRAWIDLVVSGTMLVPALPIIGLLAILIAKDGHNPFFVAERIYSNGERTSLLKLRTMHINANDQTVSSKDHTGDANDPRVTKIGKILRELNLDELPQLLQVFWEQVLYFTGKIKKSRLSMVGVRIMNPLAKKEMEELNDEQTMKTWEEEAWNILPAGVASLNSLRSTDRKGDGPLRTKYYDPFMAEHYSVVLYFYILFLAALKPTDIMAAKGLHMLETIKEKIKTNFSQHFDAKQAKKTQ